ncbi:hypothetical protein COB28_01735 [Candidatus Dependentiae bacterium]|nr:MAG: hypothetical protein COB28_01735 [Candidatus Dependentiae bacterium]
MKKNSIHIIKILYFTVSVFSFSSFLHARPLRNNIRKQIVQATQNVRNRVSRATIANTIASQTKQINPQNTVQTNQQGRYSSPNSGSRWARGRKFNKKIHKQTMAIVNKKRTVVQRTTKNLSQLLKGIANQTKALFYLVDSTGNPVSLTTITTAIGSKSIQIPNLSNLSQEQQTILNSTNVKIEENVNRWVSTYLNNVKSSRSRSLTGASLILFSQYWEQVSPRYTNALKQIFRTVSISESVAQNLGFINIDGTAIKLLFFDDPFPAHTVPGSARSPFRDLLSTFIARYGL